MTTADRLWRNVDAELFQFTTTDLRDIRIAIMLAFDDAAVLRPALGVDDVARGIRCLGWDESVGDAQLKSALRGLVEWGLLEVTQNHAAPYATAEEFERHNLQWSLSARGRAATAGLLRAVEVLRQSVSLQPAVLDAMADGLIDLDKLLDDPSADSRITTRLMDVERHHEALVGNVRQFNGELQRLLRDDATQDDVFLDVKRQTVSYLEEYVTDVERPARRLAAAIRLLDERGVDELRTRALRGANLAPVAGDDPAQAWLGDRDRRWNALRAWFTVVGTDEPRIHTLRAIARQAILQLLRVLERRWEARHRAASAADDFRALARWFGDASSEAEAHALFNAAFGLWSARHAHLVETEQFVPSGTPWCESAAVVVAPALRRSGSLAERGRPKAVADPSAIRAERQRRQAERLAQSARLRADLETNGVVRLSAFSRLCPESFGELLMLLDRALCVAPAGDGTRRAVSVDAQVEIVLGPAPGSGAVAELHTEAGVLTTPDYPVQILVLGQEVSPVESGVGVEVSVA